MVRQLEYYFRSGLPAVKKKEMALVMNGCLGQPLGPLYVEREMGGGVDCLFTELNWYTWEKSCKFT